MSPSQTTSIPLHSLLRGCFEEPSGKAIPVDFFDPQTWATYALSPVAAGMDFSHPDDCAASIAEAKARELARSASRRSQGHEPVPTVGAPGSMGEQSLPGEGEALRAGELLSQTLADVAERMGQAEGGDAAAQGEVEILKRQAMGITSVKKYLDSTLRRAKEVCCVTGKF